MGADETLSGNAALLNRLVENVYLEIVEKGFGRSEEMESDEKALVAANKIGYAPQGLSRFLTIRSGTKPRRKSAVSLPPTRK